MISENELKVGDVLGGFKLEKELGRGGMGVVFKAHELSLNRKIALKVLASRLSSSDEFIQRFRREAQIIASLKHPNIVSVLSYGEDQGLHYFAMEYVKGRDLGEILREKKMIPFDEALEIIRQVAEALAEAGSKGVVHRDIKPSNIMIDQSGRAYVTDFGVAHFADSSQKLTQTGLFLGTPEYASPEQATGRPLDVRSDIYSLGAVLYKMVSGQEPVTGESPLAVVAKISAEPVTPISQINPLVPQPLCALIDKMMAKRVDDRYQSPKDLITDLDQCIHQIKEKQAAVSLADHLSHDADEETKILKSRRSLAGILGGILGIALAVLVIVWLVEGRGPVRVTHDDAKEDIIVENKGALDEAQTDQDSPVTESPKVEDMTITDQKTETASEAAAPSAGDGIAKVDKSPPLPKTPTVLVMVYGDEFMIPSARAYLYSLMKGKGLRILSFTEIPLLREKMQVGNTPVTWYDIRQLTPSSEAQVLVLGEIRKTGTMPIHYMGRSDELTLAAFSLQAVDMETGTSIHSSVSGSIKFTPLNMDQKLQDEITNTTEGIEAEIQQYWEKKKQSRGKAG